MVEATEESGAYALGVDALCMFLADPAAFQALVDQNNTAETAD
ncbi:hypothetical protein SDC9_62010 [bioreactor metagenome]|uniref:Uncharacterized protein n=1 Tax=bioreactor metagenome TaxID=1076179 RepID=A0A644XHS2_9ZZZZ